MKLILEQNDKINIFWRKKFSRNILHDFPIINFHRSFR